MKDYYEVLGVESVATDEEIKKAYRKRARTHHPDMNPGDSDATKRFQEVQEAYDTLGDPIKKSRYDGAAPHMRFRRRPQTKTNPGTPPPGFAFEEVMEEFFGGSTFKGRNITVRLEVDFKEVLTGCTKHIKIKKRIRCTGCMGNGFTGFQPCPNCEGSGAVQVADSPFGFRTACQVCSGTGKASVVKCGDCIGSGYLPGYHEKALDINIPAGIDNGMQVRLAGEGEESLRGGRAGDVMVFVLVKEHPLFNREGPHLSVEVPVSYTQLVLGDEIEIPTLAEGSLKVKVPAGSQSHTKFRLKGKGFPAGNGSLGDLIATLKIETPKSFDEDYKQALERLSELEKKNVTPRREQWAKKVSGEGK